MTMRQEYICSLFQVLSNFWLSNYGRMGRKVVYLNYRNYKITETLDVLS